MIKKYYSSKKLNNNSKVWDFMHWDYLAFSISIFLVILSIIIITIKGLNFGLDFTGGVIIEITLEKPVDINLLHDILKQRIFKKGLLLQKFGSHNNIVVHIPSLTNTNNIQKISKKTIKVINTKLSQSAEIKRIEFVGPTIGADLAQASVIALLISLISIFFYICLRFEWRLATGIVISLLHDTVITTGMLSLFSIEIDLTIIASLMSVIGYSLNDSIVVSDRIRENFLKILDNSSYEVFNISLTQIFHRTIISSGIILLAVLILYFLGGPILKGFSLTMLIGITIGTASSIYVASALALKFGIKHKHLLQKKRKKEEIVFFLLP